MVTSAPSQEEKDQKQDAPHIAINGRFERYRSSYWAGLVAALGVRYLPRTFLKKYMDNPEAPYAKKHAYSAFAGAVMTGVTGYYALRTWSDIENIFSEAVAWETGKKKEDVIFTDYLNSDNSIIKQTVRNYVKYNAARFAVNAVYFLPFIPGIKQNIFQKYKLNGETGVDWGVGANATYLFSDVISRKITPFEEVQTLIDNKLNHVEHFADRITAGELVDVYERHAGYSKNDNTHSFLSQRGTPQWEKSMQLFERMADLLNQTYRNQPAHEQANFGFSHFVYLTGHGMIDPNHVDHSLACIEIANAQGAKVAQQALERMRAGVPVEQLLAQYGVAPAAETPSEAPMPAAKKIIEKKQLITSFAAREAAHSLAAQEASPTLAV